MEVSPQRPPRRALPVSEPHAATERNHAVRWVLGAGLLAIVLGEWFRHLSAVPAFKHSSSKRYGPTDVPRLSLPTCRGIDEAHDRYRREADFESAAT